MTFFSELSLDELSCIDVSINFFVSGYVGRSVSRRRKCSFCKELFVKGHDPTPIYDFYQKSALICLTLLIEVVYQSRHEFCYTVTALAVQYYSALTEYDHARIRFLTSSNAREAYIFALKKALPF